VASPPTGNVLTNGNGVLMSTPIPTFSCPSDNGNRLQGVNSLHYSPSSSGNLDGMKTNYDFIASQSDFGTCNNWRNSSAATRYMFGENSDTKMTSVTDGTSNTFMFGEMTYEVWNGRCSSWGYRGWVMTGADPIDGINNLTLANLIPPVRGRLGSWGRVGSLHTGGCQFALGDGSVRFVRETVSTPILVQSAQMSDGSVSNLDS